MIESNPLIKLAGSTLHWIGVSGSPEIAFGALVFLIAAILTYVQWKCVIRAILVATAAVSVAFGIAMAANAIHQQDVPPAAELAAVESVPKR